ncbi:MAG: RNA pyrophosphohydrolase [Cellvibrionales bacterium]|nr:RNA pyrophosphohydrolase [Cellvibrionales bacterium]
MIDRHGYRANVAILLARPDGEVFWGNRVKPADCWQFPQGGLEAGESPQDALFRELYEEVGLQAHQVRLLAQTRRWLRYRSPAPRRNSRCIGQKQRWFLLQLLDPPDAICLDCGASPEFSTGRWVSYWYPARAVVDFKRTVYAQALYELAPAHAAMVEQVRAEQVRAEQAGVTQAEAARAG